MNVALVTGSAGLVGSNAIAFLSDKFDIVIGIDNDMRKLFFGANGSTQKNNNHLLATISNYNYYNTDIRNYQTLEQIFAKYNTTIQLIIHTAAQPSHDWAAKDPITDFTINANGTLNLLELTRKYCKQAVFIFTSTNKVYGDTPNFLPLIEKENRWEIAPNHQYEQGIDETMSIDKSKHSLFGASKVAADVLAQEYGRYFDLRTACFRGGCLTGPNHSGAQLHGFLAYLMKCTMSSQPYTVFGYKGKQVRDNIHSADLIRAFDAFYQAPRIAQVYNIGGGRQSNCSMLEAIDLCQEIAERDLQWTYSESNRVGDHIWWVSDLSKVLLKIV